MDNNLRSIVEHQRDVLTKLEKEVRVLESSDLIKENEKLKTALEKAEMQRVDFEQRAKTLAEQNSSLKQALHEQMYNEKSQFVNTSKEKLEVYFDKATESEMNRLTVLENNIKSRINQMIMLLQKNNVDIKDDTYQKLNELSNRVNSKVTEARKQLSENQGAFSKNEQAQFEALKKEQITEEQVLEITKKNNLERFVGLNVLIVIGVLLIIIGVITAAHYTYMLLPDLLKGILMFSLGGLMLAAGEFLNRKKPNVFSLGVTAGGVGVLYVALATSYFVLEILGRYPALGLCVLITVVAFFLSTRYSAQIILVFAFVGGYLPIFSLEGNLTLLYGAMVYFVLLNLLALSVSFKKKWSVSVFIGLALNISATVYICAEFFYDVALITKIIVILYIFFAFLNYTLIPIISTYISKQRFRRRDIVLLAINTVFSSFIMYVAFYGFSWEDFTGLLAIAFAASYLLLGRLIEHLFKGENKMRFLFYITGLAFVILIIPFQFDRTWLTLGWLAEGVLLTTYGILKEEKTFKRAGYIINGLCLWSFVFFDILLSIDYLFDEADHLFPYRYLAITTGSLIILGAYIYKRTLASDWQKFYKCLVVVNLWFYAIYICRKLDIFIGELKHYDVTYLTFALTVVLTFVIAFAAPRIKILSDLGLKVIAIMLYSCGVFGLFILNAIAAPVQDYAAAPIGTTMIGASILVFVCMLSVFAVFDLMKMVIIDHKLGVQWYPLVVSAYFVIILTQNLISQVDLSFASPWISIIYVLAALAWIIFGFAKRYSFIRKFGLGLALSSVAKLFIIDLWDLTTGYRIITYFALGLTLITISFVYQHFNKRLEVKMEVEDEITENH